MPKKLLVADDDALFCKLLQLTLEQDEDQWDVVTTSSGAETIVEIERQTPDLLLLDLRMPGTDGFAVLENRRDKAGTYPVIVVSHLTGEEYQTRCTELGAAAFLPKMKIRMTDIVTVMRGQLSA